MKLSIITIATLLLATQAHAATAYEQFFLLDGKKVPSEAAIMGAIQGKAAFRCQAVEAKVSKSGTSIGIRNVKKPARTAAAN